jgi:hypothetical protein
VQENHHEADDAKGDHHNGKPGWAWGMHGAGSRGVAGRGGGALVGGVCRLFGRSTRPPVRREGAGRLSVAIVSRA